MPPVIVYTIGSGTPLEVVLELANETQEATPPIFLWQLQLQIHGETGATGEVEFASVAAPDGSLFGSDPGPITFDELPASEIVVSDVDPEFAGVPIPAQSDAPIVELGLLPSLDAEGMFVLTMSAFDTGDIDHTSYWTTGDIDPTAFDNPIDESMKSVLATIHIIQSNNLMGDFNHDLVVNVADYTVWRNGLGTIFFPDDYDIWKQHFGEQMTGAGDGSALPEPPSLWMGVGVALVGAMGCKLRSGLMWRRFGYVDSGIAGYHVPGSLRNEPT